MKLKDKAVLITGAGSGLGREMALVFTREGAKIGVNDLRPEAAGAEARRLDWKRQLKEAKTR